MRLSVDIETTICDADDNEWTLTIRVGPYYPGSRDEPPDQEIEIIHADCGELDVELTSGDIAKRLEAYGLEPKDIERALSEAPMHAGGMSPWE